MNFWPSYGEKWLKKFLLFTFYSVTVHQIFMEVVHRVVAVVGCRGGPSLGVLVRTSFAA